MLDGRVGWGNRTDRKDRIWSSRMNEKEKQVNRNNDGEIEASSFNEPYRGGAPLHAAAPSLCPCCHDHVWAVQSSSDSHSKPTLKSGVQQQGR